MATLEEIQAEKEALLNLAKGNVQNSVNVYQDYLNNAVKQENQGALYSYKNNPTVSETDKLQSRSAYLNRRAQNEEAMAEAELLNALNDDIYAGYLEADALTQQADMDALRYQDAIYKDNMAYLKERDKKADEQWQKNYDLQMAQYYQALANARSGRSSGGSGYSSGYSSGYNSGLSGFSDGPASTGSTRKTPSGGGSREFGLDKYTLASYTKALNYAKEESDKDVALYNAYINGANDKQLETLYKLYNK